MPPHAKHGAAGGLGTVEEQTSMPAGGELAPLADEEAVPPHAKDGAAGGLGTVEEQIADADKRTQLWLARRVAADARRSFGVAVVSLTGDIREVQTTADEEVGQLKLKVSKEMGTGEPDLWMLVVNNRLPLEDDTLALGAYGVEPGGSTTLNMATQNAAKAAARRQGREVARKETAERKEAERIALKKLRAKQKRIASWSACINLSVAMTLLIVYLTAGCGGLDCGRHGECRGFFGAECFCAADTRVAIVRLRGHDGYDGELCPHDDCTFEFHASRLSAADAEAECVRDGGHLASLHSQADQETVHRLRNAHGATTTHVWIGFHDRDDEQGSDGSGFKWNDGSATDYSNWHPGEPNQWRGTEEDCTLMYGGLHAHDGTWNDGSCASEFAFVCKVCRNPCAACACSGNFIQPPGHAECDTACNCNGHGEQTDIAAAWAAGSCSAGSCACSGNFIGAECEVECDCSGDGADLDAAKEAQSCSAGGCICVGDNLVGDLCDLNCSCNGHGTQTGLVAARATGSCEAGSCACDGNVTSTSRVGPAYFGQFCELRTFSMITFDSYVTSASAVEPIYVGNSVGHPYAFKWKEEARSACAQLPGHNLCTVEQLTGHEQCAAGWLEDGAGFWMASSVEGCFKDFGVGFRNWDCATSSSMGRCGAYCCEMECDCNGHGTQTDIASAWAAGSCTAGSCTCSGNFVGAECETECDCSGDGADIDAARVGGSCAAGNCVCTSNFIVGTANWCSGDVIPDWSSNDISTCGACTNGMFLASQEACAQQCSEIGSCNFYGWIENGSDHDKWCEFWETCSAEEYCECTHACPVNHCGTSLTHSTRADDANDGQAVYRMC
eukprot:COSAG06_NODE_2913_length_6099_cov_4.730500_2_plen_842_part_00